MLVVLCSRRPSPYSWHEKGALEVGLQVAKKEKDPQIPEQRRGKASRDRWCRKFNPSLPPP